MSKVLFVISFAYLVSACNPEPNDNQSGKRTSAKLISSNLSGTGLYLADSVVLTNVTGSADSVGLSLSSSDTGNTCGFNVWAANGQSTRSGMEGRDLEDFNLGDPVSWESLGWGLQGECGSATVLQIESYFMYMDLHLTIGSEDKVIRAYMGQQAPFEAGDIVLKQGSELSWYDKDTDQLVASSTGTRPSNPAVFGLSKDIPWYDNNNTEKIIMLEFRINVDKTDYQVNKDTGHVTIDIDFPNSGISISDTSSDESIMDTVRLPFLDTTGFSNLLTASLTILQDRPADEAPSE